MTDIDRILNEVSLHETAANWGVALQKNGREWEACCPLHEENTPSFTIFTGKDGVERFHCFGCQERGNVLDFTQKIKGVDLREAIKILGGGEVRQNVKPRVVREPHDPYAGIQPLSPAGEIVAGKRVRLYNPKREKYGDATPSMVFPYRTATGDLIGYVLRNDLPDGKETPMVMWVRLPDGTETWCRYPFARPRSLYRLENLAGDARQVIIAEGEKCADVGAAVTGRLFISWAGGTYGAEHADWSPLAGRKVVIWPDADAPGFKTADQIARKLTGLGCEVKVIQIPEGKPKGWDVADAAADGWTRTEIDLFMRDNARVWEDKDAGNFTGGGENNEFRGVGDGAVDLVESGQPAEMHEIRVPDYSTDDFRDGWVPDGVGFDGDRPLDKSSDLIEGPDNQARRVIPASGRAPRSGHFRVWGGEPELLREWAYLTADEKFYNVHTGERMSKSAFDMVMQNIVPVVEVESKKGDVTNIFPKASQYLLEFGDGLVCSSSMYRPDVPDMMAWVDGILHVNSFLPSSMPMVSPDWQEHHAWQIARDHIENVLPDGAKTIIQWMAHNVQHPGKKILWAPILVGEQGDGKTTIAKVLQMAMGRRNVSPVGPEALFSDFNGWTEGKCVRVLEELHVSGNNKASVVEKLKAPITNDTVDMVRKGKDGTEIANVTNYMGLTNHMNGLQIPEGDRRFGVWKTRFDSRLHVLRELTRGYWVPLHEAIDNHPGVLRGWLMNVDLSDFDPKAAPETTLAKRMMIEASRTGTEAAVINAIELGAVGVGMDVLTTCSLAAEIRETEGRSPATVTLASILQKMGWVKAGRVKWHDKARYVYYRRADWNEGLEGLDLLRACKYRLDDTLHDRPDEAIDGAW